MFQKNMNSLPTEIEIETLLQLNLHDLSEYCKQNTRARQICSLPYLWQRKLQQDFPRFKIYNPNNARQLYITLYLQREKRERIRHDLSQGSYGGLESLAYSLGINLRNVQTQDQLVNVLTEHFMNL